MKSFAICDSKETAIILKTSGIESVVASSKQNIKEILEKVKENEDIAILVITEKVYDALKEEFDFIIGNAKFPLIVRVPNRKSL